MQHITEGASPVRTDTREMAEVSAKRTVVARAAILGVAQGMLSAVRTLVLGTVDVKMPLVVTLKTNSCCKCNGLWAQLGIVRCNSSGIGSSASLMKGRMGINWLVYESEGVAHAPPAMVLFFLFLFLPLTFAFVLTAIAVLCKPGCAVSAADTSSV